MVYIRIERVLRGRRKLAAILLLLLCAAVVVVPALLLSASLVDGVRFVSSQLGGGELKIPPAPEEVARWPVVGPLVYETWSRASTSLASVLKPFQSQIVALGSWAMHRACRELADMASNGPRAP